MSNPINSIDLTMTYAEFLTAHSALLQQKRDKLGGAVPAEGTITRGGAVWANLFDDFMMALMADDSPLRLPLNVQGNAGAINVNVNGITFEAGDFTLVDNGGGRVTVNSTVPQGLEVWGDDGAVDNTFGQILFGEAFDLTDNGDETVSVDLNTIQIESIDTIIYDVIFSGLATNAFVDGNETIDGRTWTTANSAGAGATWGVVNGQGIVHTTPANTTTVFTSTTQTASYLYIPISSISGWFYGFPYFIDLHISSSTYEQSTDRCVFGLWAPAGSPESTSAHTVRCALKGNATGTITIGVLQQTTPTTSPDTHDSTAVSALIYPTGHLYCGYGTFSSGFPAFTYGIGVNADTTAGPSHIIAPTTRLVIAFPVNADASPTTTTTIARMRIRR